MHTFLCAHPSSVLMGICIPASRTAHSHGNSVFSFSRNCRIVYLSGYIIYNPIGQGLRTLISPHTSLSTLTAVFFILAFPGVFEGVDLHFTNDQGCRSFFMCLLAIRTPLGKYLFNSLFTFFPPGVIYSFFS